jgi:hypothetical protein
MNSGSVSSSVGTALRGRRALSVGESLLIAASAGIATMAAAIAGGSSTTDRQALILALAVAILAGFSWGAERIADARSVARAMDRRFGLSGAWLTAYEAESRGSSSSLAGLLAREVAPAVSVSRYVGDAARSSALFLAAPLAAAALWSLAIEARDATPVDRMEPPGAAGAIPGAVRAEALRSEAARLAALPELSPDLAAKLRVLAAEAQALQSQVRPAGDLDIDRREAERRLAARMELLRHSALSSQMTPASRDGTMVGPDSRTAPSPGASMDQTTPLPSAPVPGTGAISQGTATPGDQERGVVASRWWQTQYDSIVQRWVESGRAARDGRSR